MKTVSVVSAAYDVRFCFMLKRVLTGIVIVIAVTGAFILRQLVDHRLFNIMIFAFSVFGTFEMLRAFGDNVTFFCKCVVWAYAIVSVPLMTFLSAEVWGITTFIGVLLIISSLVFEFKNASVPSIGHSLIALLYPSGMLGAMTALNVSGDRGFIALLLVFVVTPFADTGAYVIGSILKGKRLSPEISPKKTISGFIGGLIVGAIGGLLVWLVFPAAKGVFVDGSLEWVVYLALSVVCSAVSVFGDLTEGALKRKLGIKDMGGLLPGHGGMLDRIDSTMYSAVFVYLVFSFLI